MLGAPGRVRAPQRPAPDVRQSPAPAKRRKDWGRDRWASLAAPGDRRRVPGTLVVAAVALVVGLVSSWFSTRNGLNLGYFDANSHLTIARRITDDMQPGWGQLGTVWLPVPHLLLLPFVQSLWLWNTGWAACLLGSICLSASCASLYRISARLAFNRTARIAVIAVFLSSPSLLYLYTTALTEPVLITGMLAAVAGLARWMVSRRRLSGGELAVFAGIPATIAVLSRYEGWALVLAGGAFVLIVGRRRFGSWGYAIRMTLAFVAIPAAGIGWWLAYNWATYGNALEFMFGQYSAYAQQKSMIAAGLVPTRGNLPLAFSTYNWAILEAAGAVMLVLAAFGAVAFLATRRLGNETLLLGVLASSYVFSVVSLYLGQTVINNDHTDPPGWFNSRFALSVLPVLAILAGAGVDVLARRRVALIVAVAVVAAGLAGQMWWTYSDLPARSAVVAEAEQNLRLGASALAAADWLSQHYDGGDILMDESGTYNAVMPRIGIPIVEYYNRSTGQLFDEALADPTTHAKWIFVNGAGADSAATGEQDVVAAAMAADPARFAGYRIVFRAGDHRIYERMAT